jgi:hypothetical protein
MMIMTNARESATEAMSRMPASHFVNRIVLTTKFSFETNERDPAGGGHTALWNMFKPVASLTVEELRRVVLGELLRSQRLGLVDAAIAFGSWLRAKGRVPDGIVFTNDDVRLACAPHVRESIDDDFTRVAESYWEMHTSDIGRESRVPEFLVPLADVPKGRSASAPVAKSHPEHVVPLAFIRDQCLALLEQRYPHGNPESRREAVAEMAALIRRWLVIVQVSDDEWQRLDEGPLQVKQSMPVGWDPDTGCLFARLHHTDIRFAMNAGVEEAWRCACNHASVPTPSAA